jgi:hypothetical protein
MDYTILSDTQSNGVTNETYKNKSIIINGTNEKDINLIIDGIKVDVGKTNSAYYTPIFPYQSYSSPSEISKDIIDFFLNNDTDIHK